MRLILVLIAFFCIFQDARVPAQTSPQGTSTNDNQRRFILQPDTGDGSSGKRHTGPLGKACVRTEAAAKNYVSNPSMYDHIVSAENTCSQTIRMTICYYQSTHCVDMDLLAYQRKDVVLGAYPSMQYFRYEIKEKF